MFELTTELPKLTLLPILTTAKKKDLLNTKNTKAMQKTKRKPGILVKAKIFMAAMQREIDLSHFDIDDFFADKGNEMSLRLKNGYWQINEKPLQLCSIAKQTFFDQYVKMKLIKSPITPESSFKERATEIKDRFNHIFKTQNPIEGYPNIESLIFEPKN